MSAKTICKPTVKYNMGSVADIRVGKKAIIKPIDHPSPLVSNDSLVQTSVVLNKEGNIFETENTIYVGEAI